MKEKVGSRYPYGVNQYDEKAISEMGLEIIGDIECSKIEYDNEELKTLFKCIREKCGDRHVWVLYGSDDKKTWIPL